MTESKFEKINIAFWIIYFLLIMITGLLNYKYLPNEYYDERKHELLESHYEDCGTEGMNSCEVYDKWMDKNTGEIYTSKKFPTHRHSEAKRIALSTFVYGLIWCFFSAYSSVVRHQISIPKTLLMVHKTEEEYFGQNRQQIIREIFFDSLKRAIVIVFFISVFIYWAFY